MVSIIEKLSFQPASAFERDFGQQILISERRRMTALSLLLGALLALSIVIPIFFKELLWDSSIGWQRFLPTFIFAAALGYVSLARAALGYLIRIKRQPPALIRYVNALIETSLPTVLLFFGGLHFDPEALLISPPSYAYFLFILLATLRLDFRLCVFTGLVSMVEYGALAFYYRDALSLGLTPGNTSMALPLHLIKGLLFFVGSLIAGFVSTEIKARFIGYLQSLEERNRVLNLFGQHVSPEVVSRLLEQRNEVESEIRPICVMFVDIRNFTTFSESRSPEEVVSYLNLLFDHMIESINRHHGIINKFLGDGFIAIFGAPLSDGCDIQHAVAAALDIIERIDKLNSTGAIPSTRIGIGLHAGEAVIGSVGSPLRKEYTVIGDVVNVAARIEQLNKEFGSQLLVSQIVWEAVRADFRTSEALEPVHVKGRQAPIRVFKLA